MRGENGKPLGILVEDRRRQRAALILREVSYGIEAHIEILDHRFERNGPELSETECVGKHLGQFERRARSGGHFHQPYLGTREFPADCEWIGQDREFPASALPADDLGKDLGWMLHDIDYIETTEKTGSFVESNQGRRIKAEPRFFRARLQNGVLDVRACLADSNPENS
jgi:CRISPR-associated protein Cas5d